jgi:histone chaperone ASF1
LTADGDTYGAEELEEEEALLAAEEGDEAPADPDAMVDDSEMTGAEVDAAAEESDNGNESEDLEAESSGSEDEAEEEEEIEGDADESMELDGAEKAGVMDHHADAVMAH